MNKTVIILILFLIIIYPRPANALVERLSGRILLQVEENGEAWYIAPEENKRYFLGRPSDAFFIMREQSIGISNEDLLKIPVSLDYLSGPDSDGDGLPDDFEIAFGTDPHNPDSDGDGYDDYTEILHGHNPLGPGRLPIDENLAASLAGKILLQVERNGEAWYVNPENNKRYFLGRPADAFNIMSNLGLGISNEDLSKIPLYRKSDQESVLFNWQYNNQDFSLNFSFDSSIFELYHQDPKVYSYPENEEPPDLREAYYSLFFDLKEGDDYSLGLLEELREMAKHQGFLADNKLEFILSFIQYIPYDHDKAEEDWPVANFPYETLYLNKGVCTDKVFLALLWLRQLAYGSAVLDFPDSHHAALGISCPIELSLNNSGFCYVETTNYFPLGVVPSSISSGLAESGEVSVEDSFIADNLGLMEIRQTRDGQIYYGVLDNMIKMEELANMQILIDQLWLDLADNNLDDRQSVVDQYNQLVEEYNYMLGLFYQL